MENCVNLQITIRLTNYGSSPDSEIFVQAIADIYFHATLKHPVRNTLVK